MGDERDANFEKVESKGSDKSVDSAAVADRSEREDLAASDKKHISDLKAGKSSGVTTDFGKPVLFDSAEAKASPKDTPNEAKTDAAEPASDLGSSRAEATIAKFKDADVPLSAEQEAELQDDLAIIDELPEEQREKVYASLEKLATADTTGGTNLHPQERAELVASLAHQIAHPESIQQGEKDTCVPANIEKTLAMQHPDQYADMVTQLATKGEYTTPDGKTTVKAQRNDDGTLADYSDGSFQRSMTSEVMQSAIMNLGLPEGETYRSYPPPHEPIPSGLTPSTDTGDRLVDKDGNEKRWEGLDRQAKEQILDKLVPNDAYESRQVATADDLGKAFEDNGGPPLNVTVRINAEHTGMGRALEGSAATHAVSVTHIEYGPDGKPSQVYYENTAGGDDHSYPNGTPVPANEFVQSMQHQRRVLDTEGNPIGEFTEPLTVAVRTDGESDRQRPVDPKVEEAITKFREAADGAGTDEDGMKDALKGLQRYQIEEMNKLYKERYGVSLREEIKEELDDDDKREALKLVEGSDFKRF